MPACAAAYHPAAPVTSPLTDHILRRLSATGADASPWSWLVLAALEGDASLATYLAGTSAPARPSAPAPSVPGPADEPPGAFVGAITVEGFRGVGPSCTLPLHAGPGLTLVVGRNGSGKSSFAEGLELLLTGENLRWKGRSKAWGLAQPASHAGGMDDRGRRRLPVVGGLGSDWQVGLRAQDARSIGMSDSRIAFRRHSLIPRSTPRRVTRSTSRPSCQV